jgi:hypothetical protein
MGGVVKTLWPVQERTLEWAAMRDHVGLFLQMRLGKSLCAIRWAAPNQGHKLVVGPLSVLPGWMDELEEEGHGYGLLRPPVLRTMAELTEPGRQWWLINYENFHHVADMAWNTVILDESTRIKNPSTKITRLCLARAPVYKHRAVLSGLPNPESLLDFYCQMKFVSGDQPWMGCNNFWSWRERYFMRRGFKWFPKPGTLEVIREAVNARAVTISRQQAGYTDNKVFEKRTVTLPAPARAAYTRAMEEYAYGTNDTKHAVVRDTWMFRIAGGATEPDAPEAAHTAKADEIIALLRGELRGERVVCWFRFNRELFAFKRLLRKHAVAATHIVGKTPVRARHARTALFNAGKRRVMCCQIKCGRYGVNFSGASVAAYYSMSPSGEEFAQSQDRVLHVTKQGPLLLLFILASDTVDELLYTSLRRHKQLTAKAFNEDLAATIKRRLRDQNDTTEGNTRSLQQTGIGKGSDNGGRSDARRRGGGSR